MRILSIILTTMTLCSGFTRGAWAGSELVTPLFLTGATSPFQCIVTNAMATKTVSVNVTLFDVFGTEVSDADAVSIGPRASFIQVFPSLRPLSCVVDIRFLDAHRLTAPHPKGMIRPKWAIKPIEFPILLNS